MKSKFIVTLLTASTVLAGCTLAPKYERIESNLPSQWLLEEQSKVTAKAQELHWSELFHSPQLKKVIELGLQHNHDLKLAALNVEEVRGLYGIERSSLMPDIDAVGSGDRRNAPRAASSSGQEVTTSTYQANLAVTAYELDLFGRVRSLKEAALEDWMATVEAEKAVKNALIAEIANAYLTWVGDKEILKLTEETLRTQLETYELLKKSEEKGAASRLDVAQVQQAVEAARANLALFTRQVEQDRNALTLLLGTLNAKKVLSSDTSLADIQLQERSFTGTPAEVVLTRPDVMQAEHQLKAYNANIGAARANFLPRISLTGAFGFASSDFSDLFTGGANGAWSFTPQVSLPIFNGGLNFANLTVSKARKEKAVVNYEKAIQTAFKEIADELAARKTLHTQLEAQLNLVQASQTAYDLSFTRYKTGVDSFLNVLDAQRSLFSTQREAIRLKQQSLANTFNLYKALGGGIAVKAKSE